MVPVAKPSELISHSAIMLGIALIIMAGPLITTVVARASGRNPSLSIHAATDPATAKVNEWTLIKHRRDYDELRALTIFCVEKRMTVVSVTYFVAGVLSLSQLHSFCAEPTNDKNALPLV